MPNTIDIVVHDSGDEIKTDPQGTNESSEPKVQDVPRPTTSPASPSPASASDRPATSSSSPSSSPDVAKSIFADVSAAAKTVASMLGLDELTFAVSQVSSAVSDFVQTSTVEISDRDLDDDRREPQIKKVADASETIPSTPPRVADVMRPIDANDTPQPTTSGNGASPTTTLPTAESIPHGVVPPPVANSPQLPHGAVPPPVATVPVASEAPSVASGTVAASPAIAEGAVGASASGAAAGVEGAIAALGPLGVVAGAAAAGLAVVKTASDYAGSGMARVNKELGPLGKAIGAMSPAIGFVLGTIGRVAGSFMETMDEAIAKVKNYSPELAAASAVNEVRALQADMQRASRIGPQAAKYEDFKGKLDSAASELYTELLAVLLDIFEVVKPFAEAGVDGIKVVAAGTSATANGVKAILATINGRFGDAAEAEKKVGMALKRIGDVLDGRDKDPMLGEDPFMKEFLAGAGMGAVAGPPDRPRHLPPTTLGL